MPSALKRMLTLYLWWIVCNSNYPSCRGVKYFILINSSTTTFFPPHCKEYRFFSITIAEWYKLFGFKGKTYLELICQKHMETLIFSLLCCFVWRVWSSVVCGQGLCLCLTEAFPFLSKADFCNIQQWKTKSLNKMSQGQ